jgi:hypothetical protein
MLRNSGRTNILRRIEALESRSIDVSGLTPHSPEWLTFWMRQVELYMANQEHVPLTFAGVRAYMQSVPDSFSCPVEAF